MSVSLGEPFAANLEGLTAETLRTPAGCVQACGGSPGVVAAYVVSYDPSPPTLPEPPTLPGFYPPGEPPPGPVIPPAPDDKDHDGSPAGTDCDDDDAQRFPGNQEVCDGKDQNCNDDKDDGFPDSDTDGSADCVDADDDGDGDPDLTDCATLDKTRYHGATERCDGVDQNCDSATTGEQVDGDGDGLFDACDAHPAAACLCFGFASADAIAAMPNATCVSDNTTILPPQTGIASYTGVHIDHGGGIFELAGVALGVEAGQYGCVWGCVDSFATSGGTCAALLRPEGNVQTLTSDEHAACQDLVQEVCP